MTVHTHIYGSKAYLDRHGRPETLEDLDRHRLVAYGDIAAGPASTGSSPSARRTTDGAAPALEINNVYGMLRAADTGLGLASLPDYLAGVSDRLERGPAGPEGAELTAYFVYPEEMRTSKRVAVFRDFLLEKVAEQPVW